LPCCDSHDCNLLIRFELIKPQINNAMKSLFLIPLIFILNCNVNNDKSDPCDMLVTQEVVNGGIQKYLVCGTVNSLPNERYQLTDIKYYSWKFGLDKSDSLIVFAGTNESKEYADNNFGKPISLWIQYHDEAFSFYKVY